MVVTYPKVIICRTWGYIILGHPRMFGPAGYPSCDVRENAEMSQRLEVFLGPPELALKHELDRAGHEKMDQWGPDEQRARVCDKCVYIRSL